MVELIMVIALLGMIASIGIVGMTTVIGDSNLSKKYEEVLTKMEATLNQNYDSENPKELLAFALSGAELFEDSYTVKEADPFPQGNTVSYRLAENGDLLIALSPEPGVMCAARNVSGIVISNCLSEEDHPKEYKSPLTTIADDPKVWTSDERPDYKERKKDDDTTMIPFNGGILVF